MKKKSRNGRRSNALKHGAFATTILIFDEDSDEFEELHNGLIKELKPSGRMEEELVLEIAKIHWRKRRAEKFFAREADWIEVDATGEHHLDRVAQILGTIVKGLPCETVWDTARRYLPKLYREEVERDFKCPSAKYDDEWIEKLRTFIYGRYCLVDAAIQLKRHSPSHLGETSAKLMELSAKHMDLEERLDAMLDRALKRLAQLKTYKEVLAVQGGQQSRKISAA